MLLDKVSLDMSGAAGEGNDCTAAGAGQRADASGSWKWRGGRVYQLDEAWE